LFRRHGIARIGYVAFFGILLAVISPARTIAEERVDICAQYSATGASYHVNAVSTTGSELNQATHTFNYNGLSRYIVIFWAQNQATVIEMSTPFFGPSYIQSIGTDQEGRSWGITAFSPIWCQQ
jgi:YD repeat-containing protein